MGQEITIAYTDLLQSKAMRQLDLWSKYRFIYCYERCSVVPFTYVDHALQLTWANHFRDDYKMTIKARVFQKIMSLWTTRVC
ncbi:protein SET DOMAIN GROUP 41-like isoform X3 [Arachis ipaensis]|uniref:protein SET DOMAIN GROUP 41-like isoform X3 n=1 Tax=Arachis ipaensis TaxID=130454 RepID=UPI0007AFD7D6|nr:protein SET DOMAIN GROUP 41-like isoform X3 [Arachis ipaensis]XP_025627682.1 protein SET DOMAIN GROUP 41 isoform X3 [Arachis hypogaea]